MDQRREGVRGGGKVGKDGENSGLFKWKFHFGLSHLAWPKQLL